jgi:hypothetical protein
MKGIDAIRKKNQWWVENHEIHGGDALGPWPHRRSVHASLQVRRHRQDRTDGTASAMQMEEAGLVRGVEERAKSR